MMHLAYPNVRQGQFQACVRYLSLLSSQAPEPPYHLADPKTPDKTAVHDAAQELVPERVQQLVQGTIAQVYEIADAPGSWQGASQDLAYLLALIRCSRPLVLDVVTDVGDVWCTGTIPPFTGYPMLGGVAQQDFDAKLIAFLTQPRDRLFFAPAANFMATQIDLCQQHQVQVLTLAAFREALPAALASGGWPAPAVVMVGTRELLLLSATLFRPSSMRTPQWSRGAGAPRRPYKFLDPFGLTDTGLFCGRDQEIAQLQRRFHATRLLILYGESGTGKTSLIQAGLLPSLPVERYAWVLVRMVNEEPTAAIKAALVREYGLDRQFLERPLVDGVTAATATLGKTVVLILDQFEEFFQRHDTTVRQQLPYELHACLDAPRLAVQVLIALREDYFAQLAAFQDAIPIVFHHTMRLTRFTQAQARDAVVQPAQRLGLSIDEALVQNDLIPQLTDASRIIELPLLQIVCEAWYQQVEEAHQTAIGPKEYAALGDIRTVLERYLATTLRQFGTEQPQAREVLKALVTGDNTARAVFPEELLSRLHTAGVPLTVQALEQRFLRRLVQARLVRATDVDGQTRYELTHEFLVTQITTWIAASERDRTRVLEMLARAYEVYQVTGQLLAPQALAMLTPWQEHLVLPDGQQAFLTQSQRVVHRQHTTFWRRVVGATAGLVLLLAGGGLWYWDAHQRAHVDYYATVITRRGLPEGVGRLTDEQVGRRNSSLAFHKHGRRGPVHEIRVVNSRGASPPVLAHTNFLALVSLNPLPQEGVEAQLEVLAVSRVAFERDARGQILNQIAYNRAGRPIYTLHYVQPNLAEYKTPEWLTTAVHESGVARLKFVRPAHGPAAGLAQEILFFDSAGKPQPARDGTYGTRYVFEPRGLPVETINLGEDGQPAVSKEGIAKVTATYDVLGNRTQVAFVGRDGQAVVYKAGFAGAQLAYDPYGNLQEFVSVGTDGQLVPMHNIGAAGRSFRYDAQGNLVETTFFDAQRHLVTGRLQKGKVAAFARQTIVWDAHGGSLETYFGPDGKPMVIKGRVVKTRVVWDARGYLVETAFFDEHERPVYNAEGCAKQRFTRDPHGNVAGWSCLDATDHPIRSTEGYASVKKVHDDRGNAIAESYFGPTGQPELYDEHYVKMRFTYNAQGKKVEAAFFDTTEQPIKNKETGVAKVTFRYNLQGNLTEVAFFDEQDQPIRRKGGAATLRRIYNAHDQLIQETLYDEHGHPTRHEDGYVTKRLVYDARGYRIETALFDEDDHLTVDTDGHAKEQVKYNDQGQVEEVALVGLDGGYTLHTKYGFAKVRLTYNARGQDAQWTYVDAQDRLIQITTGYATIRYTYDALGRETTRLFFDVHGVPVHTRVTIKKVEPDRVSQRLGLQVGDILVSYDGEDVRDTRIFHELELVKGERRRELRLQRQGQELRLEVLPGRLTGLTVEDRVPPPLTKDGS